MENSGGLRTENNIGELNMENCSNGLWTEDNSGWLQMENSGGFCTENDGGELQMENYSIRLQTKNNCG